jgi:hypothetical protein
MRKRIELLVMLAGIALVGAAPAAADTGRAIVMAPSDVSSQSTAPRRARTRITVTPARRTGKLVRECDFRLVREVRANGTYVVPHQRCWWARQR